MQLEDRGDLGHDGVDGGAQPVARCGAAKTRLLAQVRPNGLDDTPQLHIDIDQAKATALGLALADINSTLAAAWGGTLRQRLHRPRPRQARLRAGRRAVPHGARGSRPLVRAHVDRRDGAVLGVRQLDAGQQGPATLARYNGRPSIEIQGQPRAGRQLRRGDGRDGASSPRSCPRASASTGPALSYQERLSGAQAPVLYAISLLVVFLCLAALYESWSIPLSVLLVIPLGVVGAVLAATLRGLDNDIYFQVGLLTTMGLSAKNAILIVEFAEAELKRGVDAFDAALEAARLRLRPILMTSLAFIAGVLPLRIATGAGAASQNAIGTGVIGGMLTGTVLAIFFVPVFFVIVRRGAKLPTASVGPM